MEQSQQYIQDKKKVFLNELIDLLKTLKTMCEKLRSGWKKS
jgi:hypothetical protein